MNKLLQLLIKELEIQSGKEAGPLQKNMLRNFFEKNVMQLDAKATLAYFKAARQFNNGNTELAVNDYVAHSQQQGANVNTIRQHFNEISLAQLSQPQKAEWIYFYKHLYNRINIPQGAIDIAKDFKILCPAYNDATRFEKYEAVLQYIKTYEKLGQPKKVTLNRIVNFISFVNKQHILDAEIVPQKDLDILNKMVLEASRLLNSLNKKEKTLSEFVKPTTVKQLLTDMQVYTKQYAMPDNDAMAVFATYQALKGYSQSMHEVKGRSTSEKLMIFLQGQTKQLEGYLKEAEKNFGSKSAEFNKTNEFGKYYITELTTLVNTHLIQLDKEIVDATGLMGPKLSYLKNRKENFIKNLNLLPFFKQLKNTTSMPKTQKSLGLK